MLDRKPPKNQFFILALLLFLSAIISACEAKASSAKAMAEQTPIGVPPVGSDSTVPSALPPPLPSQTASAEPDIATDSPTVATEVWVTSTPLPPTCLSAGGRFDKTHLSTSMLSLPMEVRVYLPPCYDEMSGGEHPETRYPVLYLLHGQSFTDDQWDRLGADDVASRLIASNEITPFIIVMPRERLWEDPNRNPYGQAIIDVLIPWIDKTYRTIPDRQHRAIGGLSRGAAWAVDLGFSHWELFSSIGVHSGFYFKSDTRYIKGWIDSIPVQSMPRIFLDIGDMDYLTKPNRELEDLLVEKKILHEWYLFPGRHEEIYWLQHVEQYIRWYAAGW